jgi:hypothetical protein
MTIQEAIENLYQTFNKYTTSDMHHCNCGCINPIAVKKLASKKLRELEESDFAYYHGSALSTWGEVEHYKHFLPRILEVHNSFKGRGLVGLYEITTKLEYAQWSSWDKVEREAINNFILLDWIEFVNDSESEIESTDLKYYSYFFQLRELLKLWKLSQGTNGLRNFVYFLYHHATDILNGKSWIQDKSFEIDLKDLLNKENLMELLEMEFFEVSEADSAYSEKISIVIQMIELEKKSQQQSIRSFPRKFYVKE